MNIYHFFMISMFLLLIKSTDELIFYSKLSEEAIQKTSSEELKEKHGSIESDERDKPYDEEKNGLLDDTRVIDIPKKKTFNEIFDEKNEIDTSNEKNSSNTSDKKNSSEKSKEDMELNKFIEENGSDTLNVEPEKKAFIAPNYDTIDTIHKARPSEYPYHVAFVRKPDGRLLCQGVLIKPAWIISSVTCLQKYEKSIRNIGVLIGTSSLSDNSAVSRDIRLIRHYIKYIPSTQINDLTLVQIQEPVNNSDAAIPVDLYKLYRPGGRKCQFTSFIGDNLYGQSIDYVTDQDCGIASYPDQEVAYFCASYNGTFIRPNSTDILGCPVVCSDVVYGVKSKENLFTSIDSVFDWIKFMISQEDAQQTDEEEYE